jgi:tetratricopeptide (TPR) repeat protein
VAPAPSAALGPDAQTIAAFETAITEVERDAGAQDPRLSELLSGLGRSYEDAVRYEEALDAYSRAWHIQRIASGLHNLEQQPLVDRIILLRAKAGDWEGVADGYDYLTWLYRRNYTADDPRWLPAARRLRQWHLDAYRLPTGRDFTEHLDAQIWLYDKAIRIIEKQTGDRRLAQCFWDEHCKTPGG